MNRKLSVGLIVGALLLSGLLVGVSWGGPGAGRIAAPEVVQLHQGPILGEGAQGWDHQFAIQARANGQRVGEILWNSTGSGRNWHVTIVYRFRGGDIARGTVVVAGIFRGFSGEKLAVTGGTGAYANVRGYVVLTVEDDRYFHTLHLTP